MNLVRIARLRRPAARVGDPAASDLGGAKSDSLGRSMSSTRDQECTAAVARTQRVPGAFGCARIVGFRGLSVAWSNVLFMEPISDIDHATAVVGSVCAGLDAVRGTAFWKIGDDDLLSLAESLERVGRLAYAAQVHLTGEIDTRRVFQDNGAVSTAALLRQRLCISPGDAAARVRAARAILPRELPSGGETPPELPELRDAVDAGAVGTEQILSL